MLQALYDMARFCRLVQSAIIQNFSQSKSVIGFLGIMLPLRRQSSWL